MTTKRDLAIYAVRSVIAASRDADRAEQAINLLLPLGTFADEPQPVRNDEHLATSVAVRRCKCGRNFFPTGGEFGCVYCRGVAK